MKESLFNIIAEYIDGADVLDLFAGTGSLGIEALSRGADSVIFVDKSTECFSIISENLVRTKLLDRASICTGEVISVLEKLSHKSAKFDIVFMDPPYNKNFIAGILKIITKNGIINKDGIIIAEHDVDDIVPEEVGKLILVRNQKYGDTILSFYKACE